MAVRWRAGRMQRLKLRVPRVGPLWKAVLVFLAVAVAGQLLGIFFSRSMQAARPQPSLSFTSANSPELSLGSCQPQTHVMFLKTHKTASSTVLNMLYRFGEERGLRFALPLGYQFGYPLPFNAHRVKGYQGPHVMEYNIMGNHMRFNKVEVEKVMPADTFYFSILRDPVALAESSYAYYKVVAPAFKRAKGLADFASNPQRYYDPRLRNNHYARNLLWFDFGLDHNANFSERLVKKGEALVHRAFNLILLSEYFDESMVLLRHALCWPLDSVVSFSLNARKQDANKRKSDKGSGLTEGLRQKLREWNALDWHLYVAFNVTFWEKVRRFGKARMAMEVAKLRTRREFLARICLRDGGRPVEASRIRDKAIRPFQSGPVKILGYELQPGLDNATYQACLRMIRPEIQYKDLLDAHQFPRQIAIARGNPLRLNPQGRAEHKRTTVGQGVTYGMSLEPSRNTSLEEGKGPLR
ncbi:galactose-3-O-sulfotransferase 4 isoform X2 [Scleropages formosus]|uniref:Galactose-3-O-sulfotransferase 4 n=1 Tax=Scleropages formosus TaxID=113540 RepID=A0A8D0CHH6_SCLFO|nr:galactose-3-O-sulfotransferase 2 isoform X2 [Scleropages formosus]